MAKSSVTKKPSRAKYKGRRKRTLAEKMWVGIAILISIAMVVTSFATLFTSGF